MLPEICQSIENGIATLRRQQKVHGQNYGHTLHNTPKLQQPKEGCRSQQMQGHHVPIDSWFVCDILYADRQLLVTYIDEAFAKKCIRHPFVAT